MQYRLDMGAWNTVFAVPCALVDRHLKLAGKEQLQAILWALRHAGDDFSPEALAAALGMHPETAREAVEFWVQRGLLVQNGETLSPAPQPESVPVPASSAPRATQEPTPIKEKPAPARPRLVKPDAGYLARRLSESAMLRSLMQEAEQTLGILSPAMSHVLLMGHDDYGLPAEVLVMLLHYAKEIGKTSTAYIESMIRDWSASEVFTLPAAEEKLKELSDRRRAWSAVSSAAGLPHRAPTKKEEAAAYRWVFEWKFSREMLLMAYERCADNTGKFSAAYMDRVLEHWHREGLTSPQAVEDAEKRKNAGKETGKSYDLNEVENMSFFDMPEAL